VGLYASQGPNRVGFDFFQVDPPKFGIIPTSPTSERTTDDNSPIFSWRRKFLTSSIAWYKDKGVDRLWSKVRFYHGYQLEFSQDPNFIPGEKTYVIDGILEETYSPREPIPDGTWYWRVSLVDTPSLENFNSPVSSFVLKSSGRDTTSPRILSVSPSNTNQTRPIIEVLYADDEKGSGVDLEKIRLSIDGVEVSKYARIGLKNLKCQVQEPLAQGLHRVVLDISDQAGNQAQKKWYFILCSNPSKVSIGEDKILLVKGKHFYPNGFFQVLPSEFTRVRDLGINTVQHYQFEGQSSQATDQKNSIKAAREYLGKAQECGLMVYMGIPRYELYHEDYEAIGKRLVALMSEPSLLAWYVSDEPETGFDIIKFLRFYRFLKKLEPHHPFLCATYLPTCSSFVNISEIDIAGVASYPIGSSAATDPTAEHFMEVNRKHIPHPVTQVSEFIEGLRRVTKDQKSLWFIPQEFGETYGWTRYPTPEESKAMHYLGLIHQVQGITRFIYRHQLHQERYEAFLKPIIQEINQLFPIVLTGETVENIKVTPSDKWVEVLGKRFRGKLYLLVVNGEKEPLEARFRVPLKMRQICVLFEDNRKIEPSKQTFGDHFNGYGVHVYEIE